MLRLPAAAFAYLRNQINLEELEQLFLISHTHCLINFEGDGNRGSWMSPCALVARGENRQRDLWLPALENERATAFQYLRGWEATLPYLSNYWGKGCVIKPRLPEGKYNTGFLWVLPHCVEHPNVMRNIVNYNHQLLLMSCQLLYIENFKILVNIDNNRPDCFAVPPHVKKPQTAAAEWTVSKRQMDLVRRKNREDD